MHEEIVSPQHIHANETTFLVKLVALCPDGVIAINRSGLITIFNRAAEVLTGHSAEETIGKKNIIDIYPSSEVAREIKKHLYSDTYGDKGHIEGYGLEIKTQAGRNLPIRLSAALIYNNNEEAGSVGFFHDMSPQKEIEKKLRRLSITDALTGLYNQRYFYSSLSRETGRALRYQRPLSLICFDLDHFKACNDQLGHLEGDNILRIVGKLLLDIVRKSDTAYRYGGDEFFVLLPEAELQNAKQTGEKIRASFNDHWPYDVAYKDTDLKPVTLSVGVAQLEENETAEALIKRADVAMYEAKRHGGNVVIAHRHMSS
jgi:diguanylate cyclase (GGDEF)-like protein/PAS domain S-box-containing protein